MVDVDYIENTISKILERVHTNPNKLKIVKKRDRLTFACPICGDSHTDMHKKRGHLYFKNLYYKCYNEGCSGTFTNLCKRFDIKIDPMKRMELIEYIDLQFKKIKKDEDEWVVGKLDKLIPEPKIIEYLNKEFIDVKPVEFGSQVYMYLFNRGIQKEIILSGNFLQGISHNGKFAEPFVVFLNKIDDKVIGIQSRNLKYGKYRKFKIYTFEELYNDIYDTQLDDIEAIGYNKFGYLFNILNIDFEKRITIFEGYLDSLFMTNSVGAVGINSDYSFLLNRENDLDVRLFFDNDNIGKRKSHEYFKKGYKVFLWEKLIDDLAKNTIDPYKYKIWFNNEIKDLNKLYKVLHIHYNDLDKYFSNDKIDTIYLNYKYIKKEKKKYIHRNWNNTIDTLKWIIKNK